MNDRRRLPADCPCPSVRHPDGSPWVYRPDAACPHHGAIFRPLPPATVIPIRRRPKGPQVNQPPPHDDLAENLAVVCPEDRGNPFAWDEVPAPLTAAVVSALAECGWPGAHATEHSVVVPLDDRAVGLAAPAGRGEYLYVLWGGTRPEWSWSTAHPDAPAGGKQALLLAPADDPARITAQILRVLRTGRALP